MDLSFEAGEESCCAVTAHIHFNAPRSLLLEDSYLSKFLAFKLAKLQPLDFGFLYFGFCRFSSSEWAKNPNGYREAVNTMPPCFPNFLAFFQIVSFFFSPPSPFSLVVIQCRCHGKSRLKEEDLSHEVWLILDYRRASAIRMEY